MSGTTNDAEQRAFSEREKFVTAFNETMLKIWKEQMTLLDVIDTGALLASPKLRGVFLWCGCSVCVGCLFFLFNVFNLFGIRAFGGLLSGQRNSKKYVI